MYKVSLRHVSAVFWVILIFQVNISSAFLWNLFNGYFGYGMGIQPSIYATSTPTNQTNQTNPNAQAWPAMAYAYPTTGIAGAFDNLGAGAAGAAVGLGLGAASIVAGHLEYFFGYLR